MAVPPLQSICREAAPGQIVRTAMAKMLAEAMLIGRAAMAKMLAEPMRIADAAPGQIADAAGSKERNRISACRCG